MTALNKKASAGVVFLLIALAVLIFLPAGTLDYWQAWIFLAVFSVWEVAISVYVAKHDPKLLERRLHAGPRAEKELSQKIIQSLAMVAFVAVILLPAIDHRCGWSRMPPYVSLAGDLLVALGFLLVFFVLKENSYASAIIEVGADQKTITTGPYAIVRHPMYIGALIMLFGVPLALGSWSGLLTIIPITALLAWRLLEEERFLAVSLLGYSDYQAKVKFRLLPCIW